MIIGSDYGIKIEFERGQGCPHVSFFVKFRNFPTFFGNQFFRFQNAKKPRPTQESNGTPRKKRVLVGIFNSLNI